MVGRVPAPGLLCPSAQPARRQSARSRHAAALAAWSLRVGDTLLQWLELYRQRRALGSLSDHMLKDLGLSRSDAGRESGKRFWEG
jgi:uncharacterized protein YjiS (DUF1127 family)